MLHASASIALEFRDKKPATTIAATSRLASLCLNGTTMTDMLPEDTGRSINCALILEDDILAARHFRAAVVAWRRVLEGSPAGPAKFFVGF